MDLPVRGEVVGADFEARGWLQAGDDRVVVIVAVARDVRVGPRQVVLVDAAEYEASLPSADDVKGISR